MKFNTGILLEIEAETAEEAQKKLVRWIDDIETSMTVAREMGMVPDDCQRVRMLATCKDASGKPAFREPKG